MLSQKMSLIIGGTVLLAAGAFIWQSQSGTGELPGFSNMNNTSISQNMSFSQLMQMGENYTCTFSDSSEEGTVSGTAYIAASENKFRTDYNVSDEEFEADMTADMENESQMGMDFRNGSMISDGEFVYIWNSETNEGYKMKFDPNDFDLESEFDITDESASDANQGFDHDQEMDYNCQPWRVDSSKFVPPAEITFVDFSAQFEQMESMINTMQLEGNTEASTQTEANYDLSEMCSMCDQLPAGEAQNECLTSLGC